MNVEWLIKHVETRTKYTNSKQSQNKVRNNPDKARRPRRQLKKTTQFPKEKSLM